jgi:hypothetical protein
MRMTRAGRISRAPLAASILLGTACGGHPPKGAPGSVDADPTSEPRDPPGGRPGRPEGHGPIAPSDCDPEVRVPRSLEPPTPHAEALGGEPRPTHVRLGWPSSDPSTSASFVWGTDADTLATVVEYRAVGEPAARVAYGASYRFGSPDGNSGPDRIHEVRLCGALRPATTYHYKVGGDGAWSETYSFTTPGPPGSFDTFRVAMTGDSRGGFGTWAEIVAAIDAEDPDFVLFSGDFVDDGEDEGQWNTLFSSSGDLFARRMVVPAHGNHERLATSYFAQFSLPGNEEWFSFVYGDLQVVVLNDSVVDWDHVREQAGFVDRAFAGSSAPWRVVMHHRAAYSSSTVHGSADDLQEEWVPAFERNDVDLVLAGHNHVYERTLPIRGDQPARPGEGPVYVTSGGAGADLYGLRDDQWFSVVAESTAHYLVVDFGPDTLYAVVRDLRGNTIDAFSLPR